LEIYGYHGYGSLATPESRAALATAKRRYLQNLGFYDMMWEMSKAARVSLAFSFFIHVEAPIGRMKVLLWHIQKFSTVWRKTEKTIRELIWHEPVDDGTDGRIEPGI